MIKKTIKKILGMETKKLPPLPTKQRSDDIYLVSFPRSGNTWLSFLIANVINEYLNLKMSVNFFNIHFFVPDIHISKDVPVNLEFSPFRRIIKSHATTTKHYKHIIFLTRNPQDVMISYFYFLRDLGEYDKDISSFIRDTRYGIQAWVNHTQGWLEQTSPAQRIHMFSYEDFKENTEKELRRLFNLLGYNLEEEIIKKALEKSNLENMKRLEKETISLSIKKHKFKFVRKGTTSNRYELSEKDKDFIKQTSETIYKNLLEISNN